MRKCFINHGAPCKCCCLQLLLGLLLLLGIWPLVGSLLGFCQDPLSLLSECFHYGPRLLFLMGLIPGAGGHQQKRAGFPLMPFMTPTLAFYKYAKTDEGTDNTRVPQDEPAMLTASRRQSLFSSSSRWRSVSSRASCLDFKAASMSFLADCELSDS